MTLYALSGLPGSGKSTCAKQLAETRNACVFHFDDMPGANRRGRNAQAYDALYQCVRAALSDGRSVVVDGIYTTTALRGQLLDAVHDIPCRKICVRMNTPLDECLRRNRTRERRRSSFSILAIHANDEPPCLDEGWDKIEEVNP